jgi:[histone H3]-trimethyl-L-lysine4 demethylase
MRYRNTEFMIKCGWNLNNLPYVSALQYLNESAGGVTRPMIYVGMMFSSFCWHTEDNFLYSINYVHTGAPKRWYGVPASAAHLVEQAFEGEVPHLIQKQPNLLYLLVTQLPPDLMRKKYGIPVCTTLQREGEFVVTFPRAYHAGFNNGFNVAESVNFAAPDWLPQGRIAVEEYRNKRSTVFAIEELLTKSAIHAKAISDIDFARGVRDELRRTVETDLTLLDNLEKECTSDEDCLMYRYLSKEDPMGDYPQCEVCGYDCFLWNCVCECSPDTPKCLRHVKACECPTSSKTIVARFTTDQLRSLMSKIDSRARELEIFTPIRTRSSRGTVSPKKIRD